MITPASKRLWDKGAVISSPGGAITPVSKRLSFRGPGAIVGHAPRIDQREDVCFTLSSLGGGELPSYDMPGAAQRQTGYPARCAVRLKVSFPNAEGTGSGVLIGERHVLTAGHNVFAREHGGWAYTVECIPGQGAIAPYDRRFEAILATAPQSWITAETQEEDWLLLTLGIPIGRALGWLSLASLPVSQLEGRRCACLGQYAARYEGKVSVYSETALHLTSKTTRGCSGSGVVIELEGQDRVVGVVSGERTLFAAQQAARLNADRIAALCWWMGMTLKLD